jgi:hypothetical protein
MQLGLVTPRMCYAASFGDATILNLIASLGAWTRVLLCAEVALCRLDRCVTEQQLDLLKLGARRAAQLRASATKVMGRDAGDADLDRISP